MHGAKKIVRLLGYLVLCIILIILVFIQCYTSYEYYIGLSSSGIQKEFGYVDNRVVDSYYIWEEEKIHYVDIGDTKKPILVFIHGAPGNLKEWKKVIAQPGLLNSYRVILIDRLGYGRSTPGKAYTNINDHIHAYSSLVENIVGSGTILQKPLLIGHSYGGPIVIGMAMKLGTKISGVISVSAAIDPMHEKIFWISYPLQYFPFKWVIGSMLRVANEEKIAHSESLTTVTNRSHIQVPVHAYHGTEDSIVPYENLAYLSTHIPPEWFHAYTLTGYDHPLHMTNPEIFSQAIQTFNLFLESK